MGLRYHGDSEPIGRLLRASRAAVGTVWGGVMGAGPSGDGAGLTILVVDDDRKIVELVTLYLQKEGYHVLQAFDGHAALALARAEEPDLAILDLMLPGINGLVLCKTL